MQVGKRMTALVASSALVTMTGPLSGAAVAAPSRAAEDGITHEENDRVPEGAVWTQAYFDSADGVELHADVLRPADASAGTRTPVILSVGPYFGHAGQTGPEGFTHTGPSGRFNDLVEGGDLFANGYTFVMVDLRGFGGSTGCLDWVGPGEQADVAAAIEWSASQPWSDGNVGMYGKSYDATTGLVGNNLNMPELKAVVAQEPLWDPYNYLFSNGVPRPNVTGTPNAYNHIATMAPLPDDDAHYQANARYEVEHPECLANNLTNNNEPDRSSPYWQVRDLPEMADNTRTPLFITQGFIENNTKPEDMEQFLTNHEGPERGWLGQWDHVRGNDRVSDGRLAMGREGWFEEVMRFYDQNLKGSTPSLEDPAFFIEDSLGVWREAETWPIVDRGATRALRNGAFIDDGASGSATDTKTPSAALTPPGWDMENAPAAQGLAARETASLRAAIRAAKSGADVASSYLVWSQPVTSDVRVTGTPGIDLTVSQTGNVQAKLWDIAPNGRGVMFDENVALLTEGGRVSFDLKSTDWTLQAGHQLALEIGTIRSGSWRDQPTGNTVRVNGVLLRLDLENPDGDAVAQGARSPYLDTYLQRYTTTVAELGAGSFTLLPGRL